MSAKTQLVTIWLFHQEGRKAAGHNDAERAWTEAHALPPRSPERIEACNHFNPVEIGLSVDDVDRAVAKWERVAGLPGVCHVEIRDRRPRETVQKFYDFATA